VKPPPCIQIGKVRRLAENDQLELKSSPDTVPDLLATTVSSYLCKVLAIKNKEVFLTILRHHVREGHLQYLNQLRADLYAEDTNETDEAFDSHDGIEARSAKNDSIPCELGLSYPLLQSIMAGRRNSQAIQVRLYRIRYRILWILTFTF
jgi:hypothetical protein